MTVTITVPPLNASRLVGVGEAAHAGHDAQHVVVRRIHVHVRRGLRARRARTAQRRDVRAERRRRERQVEHRVVNAREVARSRGLEVLRLERERVHVDARRRRGRVVLVRLDEVEVRSLALREPVLAVQLNLRDSRRVAQRRIRITPRRVRGRVAVHVAGVLDNPHELLHGVVERELDLVRRRRHGLRARELELLDQVLVRDLGEAAALLRVEVDVVHIQRARAEAQVANVRQNRRDRRRARLHVAQVRELVELHVDLHLVVLERNQRQREARVAVEPELQRDVQRLLRDAVARGHEHRVARRVAARIEAERHVRAERAVIAQLVDAGVEARQVLRIRDVQLRRARAAAHVRLEHGAAIAVHHVHVRQPLARGERQLIPHVEPLTVVLVDLLAADLNVHVVDQVLAEVRHPRERATARHNRVVDLGQRHLDVHARDQITVARDRALYTLAEVAHAVERLLNRLHREVRVAAVELLKKSNLRVRRQVYVLSAIGDELHKATGCHCLYFTNLKFFGQIRGSGDFNVLLSPDCAPCLIRICEASHARHDT